MSNEPQTPVTPVVAPAISPVTTQKFQVWSEKLGIPVPKLIAIHGAIITKLRQIPQYANQQAPFFDARARRLMATKYASVLRSPAESFLYSAFYVGPKVNTNQNAMDVAAALYADPATRPSAIAEGLVTADGKPIDQRQWFVMPDPKTGVRGRKNPNYGKELEPFNQRRVLAFGRKYKEAPGIMKLLVVSMRSDQADLEIPKYVPMKTRLNLRSESAFAYGLTSSMRSKIEEAPEAKEELATVLPTTIGNLLDLAPAFNVETKEGIKTTIFTVDEFVAANIKNRAAITILEGDIIQMPDEPTASGNYRVLVGDVDENIDAPAKTCFVPADVYNAVLKPLGIGSRCYFIGVPREADDFFTQEKTSNINVDMVHVKSVMSKEESEMELGADINWEE